MEITKDTTELVSANSILQRIKKGTVALLCDYSKKQKKTKKTL